jgi:hypothetical protein
MRKKRKETTKLTVMTAFVFASTTVRQAPLTT